MISVELRPALAVSRGKLVSGSSPGFQVHAATYLHERRIILDSALLRKPPELKRIFAHELFHFVWWKLGNARRLSWERVLTREVSMGARGELGWSAESRKEKLSPRDIQERTRLWREYCCESFCDTGASLFVEAKKHGELTLGKKLKTARLRWLGDIIRTEEDLVQIIDPKLGWGGFDLPASVRGLFPSARSACRVSNRPEKAQNRA